MGNYELLENGDTRATTDKQSDSWVNWALNLVNLRQITKNIKLQSKMTGVCSFQIFTDLDSVVTDSYNQLDETARISENMDPLLEFINQTDELKTTLETIQDDAIELNTANSELEGNLTVIQGDIISNITDSSCADVACIEMIWRVGNLTVSNYTVIAAGLQPLITGLDNSDVGLVFNLLSQGNADFKDIVSNINDSVSEDIEKAREASDDVAVEIEEELDKVTKDLTDVGFADMADDLRDISKDDMKLPATITFWVFTGFAIIIALIVLLTWLGKSNHPYNQ